METEVKTRVKRSKKVVVPTKERKRIPVEKIYWKKGTYKELVPDPYNLN